MTNVYMTVQGRSRDTTRAIAASRARFGVESSKDWIDGYAPQFVDFPFTDPDATTADHLDAVREWCPTLTVAPDIEGDRTLSGVVETADALLRYAQDVIVVPKTVHPSRVPDRFRVGVPLADFGSSAPFNLWAYRDCSELHLLGGAPRRQFRAASHLSPPVASVDTATLGQRCRFGMWDDGSEDAPERWDYRQRLKASLTNYWAAWQSHP